MHEQNNRHIGQGSESRDICECGSSGGRELKFAAVRRVFYLVPEGADDGMI